MRISDLSSDVCSSDLRRIGDEDIAVAELERRAARGPIGLPQAEIVDDEIEPAFGAVVVGDPAYRLAARIELPAIAHRQPVDALAERLDRGGMAVHRSADVLDGAGH